VIVGGATSGFGAGMDWLLGQKGIDARFCIQTIYTLPSDEKICCSHSENDADCLTYSE
jgi:hypothetical protein